MSEYHKKPGTPGDILAHHGIKGMKWGVRKEDDTGGFFTIRKPIPMSSTEKIQYNAETKRWMKAAAETPKPTSAEAKRIFAENQQKSAQKVMPDGSVKSGSKNPWNSLSPGQKKAIGYTAAGAVIFGGLYLGGKRIQAKQLETIGISSLNEIDRLAGKPITPIQYNGLVGLSQGKTWFGGTGYCTERAFARPAFELPAGTVFHRLSLAAETDFSGATYCTHSIDNFNRYVTGFRGELGGNAAPLKHITWKSNAPMQVPNLTTVLGQLHRVLTEEGQNPTEKDVLKAYRAMSGGGWSNARSTNLINHLKEQGYSAIVDEMDAGVIGETPLVFFGSDKTSAKSSEPFTKTAVMAAEAALKEIGNPPGRKY